MVSLNKLVEEYTQQLELGRVQLAYRGIMSFLSDLRAHIGRMHTEYTVSALYFGYMDMTYFAILSQPMKEKRLKTAIVYLHQENRFEVWLGGINRAVQAEYIQKFSHVDLEEYKLSQVSPGVDSIVEHVIVEKPDFDSREILIEMITSEAIEFSEKLLRIIRSIG